MDGATSADGRAMGSYVHGFFQHDAQRAAWLARFGAAAIPKSYAAESNRCSTHGQRISNHIAISQQF